MPATGTGAVEPLLSGVGPDSASAVEAEVRGALLLGIFGVDWLENLSNLLFGVLGIVAARMPRGGRLHAHPYADVHFDPV